MQLERYNDKYKRAKDGKFSPDENASIITKHDEYISEVRKSVIIDITSTAHSIRKR
jgi:uncharacterized protein YnzC (UPF0291/DUF896 family)